MDKKIGRVLTFCLVIGTMQASLIIMISNFYYFIRGYQVVLQEPNLIMAITELISSVLVLALSIIFIAKYWKKLYE